MTELRDYQEVALEKVEEFINAFSKNQNAENQNRKFYFSMATGSGKTIIMIELIKKLFEKMENGKLEKKYILILFPDEDLENQFKKKCKEHELKYKISSLKKGLENDDKNLFYTYRIDLLKKKKGENQIDYTQFSKGDFYLIVDEAHKGQSGNAYQDAIKFLSENGLQFLFSATFDKSEILKSEYYEYSLEDHIEKGYGKEIFIMEKSNENEMEKNLVRTMIIFYFLKKQKEKLNDFHNPLIAFFVSSINDTKTKNENQKTIESKLKEILNCIFSISKNGKEYFDECKNEFENFNIKSEFQNKEIEFDKNELENLKYGDVIKSFFNSNGDVSKEGIVYDVLDNKKEYGLYVKNESKNDNKQYSPFCLIKIGSINNVNKFFEELKITQVDKNKTGHFKKISENNINIIIGAYAFYTGWDTDRINILNYHGIGGSDIFGLQSLGRAMRVNSKNDGNKGKRFWDDNSKLLESVFIFESKKDHIKNLLNKKNIIRYLHNDLETKIKLKMPEIISEIKNENIFPLYIPIFSKENDEQNNKKYFLSKSKIEKIKNYIIDCDKKILFYKLFIRCNEISQKEILKCMENLDEYVEQNSKIYILCRKTH